VTPVVIDASAGVELAADTVRGRALRALLPADAVPWVPELFYVECAVVLRRWDLNGVMAPLRIADSIRELMAWPLRVTQVRGLFEDAWRLPANLTAASQPHVRRRLVRCSCPTPNWRPLDGRQPAHEDAEPPRPGVVPAVRFFRVPGSATQGPPDRGNPSVAIVFCLVVVLEEGESLIKRVFLERALVVNNGDERSGENCKDD
jgi:predicted nucleic acid-binding protein